MEVAVAGVLQVIVHHRVVLLISYPVNDSNIPQSRLRTALCRNHQVSSFTMYHAHLTSKTTICRYHNDHIHILYISSNFIHCFLFTSVQIPTMKSVNNLVDVVIPKKPIQQRSNTSSPADFLANRSPGSSLGNTSGLNTPQMAGTVLPAAHLPSPPDIDLYQGAVLSPPSSRYTL